MSEQKNFRQMFRETVDGLAGAALAAGATMAEICTATGVSRATPSRWRKKIPATVATLGRMQDEIERRAAEKASS